MSIPVAKHHMVAIIAETEAVAAPAAHDRRSRPCKSVMQCILALAVVIACFSAPTSAQPAPEPINQPLVDEFGVERKTGRALLPLPEINRIGGGGDSALVVRFEHTDGSALRDPGVPSFKRVIVNPYESDPTLYIADPQKAERYLYISVSYGGISERFRQMWDGQSYSGPFVSEYPTGSTFDGVVFETKHGLKIRILGRWDHSLGTGDYRVEYPSGLVKEFSTFNSDGIFSVSNSYGFAIQSAIDIASSTFTYQSINLAEDFCDLQGGGLCSSLGASRIGTIQEVREDLPVLHPLAGVRSHAKMRTFTNPAGEATLLRHVPIASMVAPPFCTEITIPGPNGGQQDIQWEACTNPVLEWKSYPASLQYPNSPIENITIDYNVLPYNILYDPPEYVVISQLDVGGISVEYDIEYIKPGQEYGAASPVRYYISAKVDGEEVLYTQSFQLHPYWGQTRRVLLNSRDANGRWTEFGWNSQWLVDRSTAPEGNEVSFEYDSRENIVRAIASPKAGSLEHTLVTSYSYAPDCTSTPQTWCNKPLSMIDPMGNVTEYEYNQYGQLTRETGPAPAPGAARPTVVNEYTMRQAYIKDASGNAVVAGPPISMLTKSYTCISSTVCDATTPATDKVVTEYDYGPTTGLNNLLLRGVAVTAADDQGQLETLRTCYQYNYFGERIAETQPNADLASCQ